MPFDRRPARGRSIDERGIGRIEIADEQVYVHPERGGHLQTRVGGNHGRRGGKPVTQRDPDRLTACEHDDNRPDRNGNGIVARHGPPFAGITRSRFKESVAGAGIIRSRWPPSQPGSPELPIGVSRSVTGRRARSRYKISVRG